MNAENSPLLRFPSEVREEILVNIVGDNLIHVKYLYGDDLIEARRAEGKEADEVEKSWDLLDILGVRRRRIRTDQGAFRRGTCRAVQSEQDAYEEMISGHATRPEDDSPGFFVDQLEVLTQEERKARTVDLNILGVCRQLYEEANHLLWATNVFSLDDSVSFDKFLGSLNPAQKRNLTGLHLHTKIGCWSYNYDMTSLENWATAFKMPYINMLCDVQTLHICFEQRFKRSYGPSPDSTYNRSKWDQDADVKPFLRLRALPKKNRRRRCQR